MTTAAKKRVRRSKITVVSVGANTGADLPAASRPDRLTAAEEEFVRSLIRQELKKWQQPS
jgi:hypothetical protein